MGKKKVDAKVVVFHARLTVEHAAKLEKLGGVKWLRAAIEAADDRTDKCVLQEMMNEISAQEYEDLPEDQR